MEFSTSKKGLQGTTTTTRYIPIDKALNLRWIDNPKLHDLQAIWQSIEANGFRDKPAWDSNLTPVQGDANSGALIFGNGRVEALHWGWKNKQDVPDGVLHDDAGLWYVPCEFGLDSTSESAAQAFGIDHNSLTMSGGDFQASDMWRMYDRDTLAALGERIASDGNGAEAITLDGETLNELRNYINPPTPPDDVGAQIDKAAELQEKWQVKTGDLWVIGKHRLLCGDSTNADDVARVMGGDKAHGCFTSPPYAEQRKEQYGGIPADEYVEWWKDIQENVRQSLLENGSFFVNIKNHTENGERVLYTFDLVLAMRRVWDWCFIDELCWRRASLPIKPTNRFKNYFEPIYHFAMDTNICFYPDNVKGDRTTPNPKTISNGVSGTGSGFGTNPGGFFSEGAYPSNVLDVWNGEPGGNHAARFPVPLPEFFIKAYSGQSDMWFDPFGGSGTTMVACEQLQRQCRMIEIEPKYCAVILERMSDMGLEPMKSN